MDYDPLSDEELIARYYAGDDQAFAALYQRYFPELQAFFYRRTRNRADAFFVTDDPDVRCLPSPYQLKHGSVRTRRGLIPHISNVATLRSLFSQLAEECRGSRARVLSSLSHESCTIPFHQQ
jgi:hypothetical protein